MKIVPPALVASIFAVPERSRSGVHECHGLMLICIRTLQEALGFLWQHNEEYRQRRKADRPRVQICSGIVRRSAYLLRMSEWSRRTAVFPMRIASGRQVPEGALGVCRPHSTGEGRIGMPSGEMLVGQSPVWILDCTNFSNRPQERLAFAYGCPPCVRIISGIAATAAAVISVRKTTPRKVTIRPLTCLPITFLAAAVRRIG